MVALSTSFRDWSGRSWLLSTRRAYSKLELEASRLLTWSAAMRLLLMSTPRTVNLSMRSMLGHGDAGCSAFPRSLHERKQFCVNWRSLIEDCWRQPTTLHVWPHHREYENSRREWWDKCHRQTSSYDSQHAVDANRRHWQCKMQDRDWNLE